MANEISFDGIYHPSFRNTTALTPFPGQLTPLAAALAEARGDTEWGGGGGIGKVLGVVVAIAVPFVAPAVASAIGLGSSILASAATGAVLGGLGAAATGGDWRMGALTGGLGAGLVQYGGGFGSTNNPLFGQATTSGQASFLPQSMGGAAPTPAADVANVAAAPGQVVQDPTQVANAQNPNVSQVPGAANTGTSTLSADVPVQQAGTAGGNTVVAGNGQPGVAFQNSAQVQNAAVQPTPVSGWDAFKTRFTGGTTPVAGDPTTWSGATNYNQAVANYNAAQNVAANKWADVGIMAGIQGAGQLYAASQAEKMQQQIDDAKRAMDEAQNVSKEEYAAKKKNYEDLLATAKNIDPTYFARQAGNEANITAGRRLAEAYRDPVYAGLRSPSLASAEARRASLGATQSVGTAFDRGYQSGSSQRMAAMQNAANAFPRDTSAQTYMNNLNTLNNMYSTVGLNTTNAANRMTNMLGTFAYPFLGSSYRTNQV